MNTSSSTLYLSLRPLSNHTVFLRVRVSPCRNSWGWVTFFQVREPPPYERINHTEVEGIFQPLPLVIPFIHFISLSFLSSLSYLSLPPSLARALSLSLSLSLSIYIYNIYNIHIDIGCISSFLLYFCPLRTLTEL